MISRSWLFYFVKDLTEMAVRFLKLFVFIGLFLILTTAILVGLKTVNII